MAVEPEGRVTRASSGTRRALVASCILGLWLGACSADVDGYRALENQVGGSGGAKLTPSGGRTSNGGNEADASADGGRPPGGGGSSPTGGAIGAGGRSTGGSGNTGGQSNGGTAGNGGANTGGATNTGGTVNTGGATNTGGTVNTGGVTNTGGASTGGGGGALIEKAPAIVKLSKDLTKITAGAWNGRYFWALEPAAHRFWRIDPTSSPAIVSTELPAPTGTIAPHAFAVSDKYAYVVADSMIYRLPVDTGYSGQTGIALGMSSTSGGLIHAAWAGGYLMLAKDDATQGARVIGDLENAVTAPSQLTKANYVTSDGVSFLLARTPISTVELHRITPGTWTLNSQPCVRTGGFGELDHPITISYATVGWTTILGGGTGQARFEMIIDGKCTASSYFVQYADTGFPGLPISLVNPKYAVLLQNSTTASSTVVIVNADDDPLLPQQRSPAQTLNLGSSVGNDIVASNEGHALIIGTNFPVLVSFGPP